MSDEHEIECLADALAVAQGEFPPIPLDGEATIPMKNGKSFGFKYATLPAILGIVRPILSKHYISVVQIINDGALCTQLRYRDEMIESRIPMPANVADWKAFGGAITYARRYALVAMLGIAGEEDADATIADDAEGSPPPASQERQPAPAGRWEQGDDLVYTWEGEGDPDDAGYRALYTLLAKALQPRDWTPAEAEAAHKFAEANRKIIGTLPDGGRKKIEEYWSALPDPETGEVA